MPRAGKAVEQPVLAQDVAHVLTQEALDAFAKFLDALDIRLRHAPGAIRRRRRARRELPDCFLDLEIP
jgi:hypothetical protein